MSFEWIPPVRQKCSKHIWDLAELHTSKTKLFTQKLLKMKLPQTVNNKNMWPKETSDKRVCAQPLCAGVDRLPGLGPR